MFAVVRTGGKQYKVAPGDVIIVERLLGDQGAKIALNDVLLMGEGADVSKGAGKAVSAEIIEQIRGDKVIIFKKRKRHTYRRKNGHRQDLTVLRVTEVGGVKAAVYDKSAAAKAAKAEAPVGAPVSAGLDASNLSLISGVGPTIEKKLRAAGIQSWNDIAAWSDADIAKWDAELKLSGRATREDWVEQAKELLAGKPPRAKVDKAEAASGEDH
jgi:large subunit ribosomal protein L21